MFVCALVVTGLSDVTTVVHFSIAAKSHDSAPWRIELVFESPSLSSQASMHRGRAKVDVCLTQGASRTGCRQWRSMRYRQYDGHSGSYRVFDLTTAVTPSWSFCYPKPCRFLVDL